MCALKLNGDSLRDCRFISGNPSPLLKERKTKLRCIPDKFWISRSIFVHAMWILQTSLVSGYKWGHMNRNNSSITVLLFPLAYFRIPWFHQRVTQLYRRICGGVAPMLANSILIFIYFRPFVNICSPRRHLKMSLYCSQCFHAILWDHKFLVTGISSYTLQSSKSYEEPK